MKIAIITDFHSVNSNYRAYAPAQLAWTGHSAVLVDGNRRFEADDLAGFDVVHIYRYHDRRFQQLARALRMVGVAIVWDCDDNLLEIPVGLRTGALLAQRRQHDIGRMIGLADIATSTSQPLAAWHADLGAERTVTIENYLPVRYGDPPLRMDSHDRLVVGWFAASEHRQDDEQLGIGLTLTRLLERWQNLHVEAIGNDLRLSSGRYSHLPVVQYEKLAERVATFDIGLAPLIDSPFNRARSNVKLKEYAFARVPWLASPVGPYVGLGEKQGGRLVADGDWEREIERLLRSARDRRKLAKKGRSWAEGQTATRNLAQWERVFVEAVERARVRKAGGGARTAAAPAR